MGSEEDMEVNAIMLNDRDDESESDEIILVETAEKLHAEEF